MTDLHRPQSLANHRNFPPWFVTFSLILIAEVFHRLWILITEPALGSFWALAVAFGLLFALVNGRLSAIRVQDRLIRLEMRLRLERLLGKERRDDIERIEPRQLVALRFAGDAELPELAADVLARKLVEPADIKQRITDWQADWLRV